MLGLLAPDTVRDGRGSAARQAVENLVVGAPCGVMDQMTAHAARRIRRWRCLPTGAQDPVPLR